MKKLILIILIAASNLMMPDNSKAAVNYKLTAYVLPASENHIDIDIYLLNTSTLTDDLYYYIGQYIFNFNTGIANGGTLSASLVTGNCSQNLSQCVEIDNGELRVMGSFYNYYLYKLITKTSPGEKIGKIRISTTAATINSNINLTWKNTGGFFTKVIAILDPEISTASLSNITNSANHFVDVSGLGVNNVTVTPNLAGYETLGEAFNGINNLKHGTGNIVVKINNNTVEGYTVKLNGGVFNSCKIFPTVPVTIKPSLLCANFSTVVLLDGADNVTIDGRINETGAPYSLTIDALNTLHTNLKLVNGATGNAIRYIESKNSASENFYVSTSPSGGNNSNYFESNKITGGTFGMRLKGNSSVSNTGNIIAKNIVNDCKSFGICVDEFSSNTAVTENQIFNITSVVPDVSGYSGIAIFGGGVNEVRKNKIYGLTFSGNPSNIYGIFVNPKINNSGIIINVVNNFVTIGGHPTCSKFGGIASDYSNAGFTENVFHNSVYLHGASSSASSCNYAALTSSSSYYQKNNIFVNKKQNGLASSITGVTASSSTIGIDYNCYWSSVNFADWNSVNSTQLPSYQCLSDPQEQNTIFKDIQFVDAPNGDLHLTGNSVNDYDLIGKSALGITDDFEGFIRNSDAPYIGADEAAAFNFTDGVIRVKVYLENIPVPDPNPKTITISLWECDEASGEVLSSSPFDVFTKQFSTSSTVWVKSASALSLPANHNFYIAIKFPGALETWSKNLGESFSTIPGKFLNYDFTTGYNKAFCDNLKTCGCKYFIYMGDTNGDGVIDVTDEDNINTDVLCSPNFNGTGVPSGGKYTDVNLDGVVDCIDKELVCINMAYYPFSIVDPQAASYDHFVNRPKGPVGSTTYESECDHSIYQCTCP